MRALQTPSAGGAISGSQPAPSASLRAPPSFQPSWSVVDRPSTPSCRPPFPNPLSLPLQVPSLTPAHTPSLSLLSPPPTQTPRITTEGSQSLILSTLFLLPSSRQLVKRHVPTGFLAIVHLCPRHRGFVFQLYLSTLISRSGVLDTCSY